MVISAQRDLRMNAREIERFWAKIVVDDVSDCWVWVGGRANGYGYFWLRGRLVRTHRTAFETWRGPIPAGKELDHVVCDFRACSNPWHVKPATQTENILRGESPPAMNARKDRCFRGHALVAGNLEPCQARLGKRICSECRRLRDRERRRKALALYRV